MDKSKIKEILSVVQITEYENQKEEFREKILKE